jgi:hypothetical protein
VPENVTRSRSDAASAGPTPRTRSSCSNDPNAPRCSRSSTMRRASAGPILGNASMAAAFATSRSMGALGSVAVVIRVFMPPSVGGNRVDAVSRRVAGREAGRLPFPLPVDRAARSSAMPARAESTSASCRASARRVAASSPPLPRAARTTRTPAPRTMTPARNSSACRSAGVGMGQRYRGCAPVRHPFVSRGRELSQRAVGHIALAGFEERVTDASSRFAGITMAGAWREDRTQTTADGARARRRGRNRAEVKARCRQACLVVFGEQLSASAWRCVRGGPRATFKKLGLSQARCGLPAVGAVCGARESARQRLSALGLHPSSRCTSVVLPGLRLRGFDELLRSRSGGEGSNLICR